MIMLPGWEPQGWAAPARLLWMIMLDPPLPKSNKACIIDTDGLWGYGGHYVWAWKALCVD